MPTHKAGRWVREAVALALLLSAVIAWPPRCALADTVIGSFGSGAGQTAEPRGLAVDPGLGLLYVADMNNNRIDVFSVNDGSFVRAFGWGVADGTTQALQVCTTLCFKGLAGAGTGQFAAEGLRRIAADPGAQSVLGLDAVNTRAQAFSATGSFLFKITAAEGGPIGRSAVSIGPSGVIYVAGVVGEPPEATPEVQKFSPSGEYLGKLMLASGGGGVTSLAVDASGAIYVGTSGKNGAIRKYDSAGNLLATLDFPSFNINAIALGPSGELFVADNTGPSQPQASTILEYDSSGTQVSAFYGSLKRRVLGLAVHPSGSSIYATEEGRFSLQGSGIVQVPLPPPGPIVLPSTEANFASPVGNTKATIHVSINPEGKPTTYRIQYVTQAGFEEGGFAGPAVEETGDIGPIGSDFTLHSVATQITGLDPETVYHFRVLAANADSPEGNAGPGSVFETEPPIRINAVWAAGIGTEAGSLSAEVNPLGLHATGHFEYVDDATYAGSGFALASEAPVSPAVLDFGSGESPMVRTAELAGLAPATGYRFRLVATAHCKPSEPEVICMFSSTTGSFTTFPAAEPASGPCPNSDRRTGAALWLADCRAYEMVSPIDKNGANIETVFAEVGFPAELTQGAADGQSITYSAYRAFGGGKSAPYTSQYLAHRSPTGWLTDPISPPREGASFYGSPGLDTQYKGFTGDLCQSWLVEETPLLLAPKAVAGYPNLYQRADCGAAAGAYTTLTTVKPLLTEPKDYHPELQGFAADGSMAVFDVPDKLTSDARLGIAQLYEAKGGVLKLVCILPNGISSKEGCSAGTPEAQGVERKASLSHAVSDDGSRIFWTAYSGSIQGPGKLYVRIDGNETEQLSEGPAQFWTASADGSVAFFSVKGSLYEFLVDSDEARLVAGGVSGVAGASEDGSHLYFASTEALTPEAEEGAPNLYLRQNGEDKLIAAVPPADVTEGGRSPVSRLPLMRMSRVTPDGSGLVFMSTGQLTGYENIDAVTGERDAEVFLYNAKAGGGEGKLVCLSCNPTGGRPVGKVYEVKVGGSKWPTAARIPTWTSQLYPPRIMSGDGRRVFFDSYEGLVAGDQNGVEDVYEWEADGSGSCSPRQPTFQESSGGCLTLISSGGSASGSELVDSSTTGNDVFLKTYSSLVSQDPGLLDIYDARVDGGFPPPPPPPVECEGEACQTSAPPPPEQVPGSSSFVGPGNPTSKAHRPRCRKGTHMAKRHGKRRCVKDKKLNSKGRVAR